MHNDANHKSTDKSKRISPICSTESVALKQKNNRKNIYKFPLDLFAELIEYQSQIPILMALEKKCFPTLLQDEQYDFSALLEDEYASGLIIYQDEIPIGYIMGNHINEIHSSRVLESNTFVQEHQDEIFYISSIAILKEYRSVIALEFMIHEMGALLKSIGYAYFSAHVRKTHGLARLLMRRLAGQVILTEEDWVESGESFDYCLIDLESVPTLPVYADYIFHWLRVARRKMKGIPQTTS